MYNSTVVDCFFNARHVGRLDDALPYTVCYHHAQKSQGTLVLSMQCTKNGLIEHIVYKTNGNPYLIAALEWCCRELEGAPLASLVKINYPLLIERLSIPTRHYPLAVRVVEGLKQINHLMNEKLA
ncbi:MAG: hypothetical protein BGO90_08595 [Legionella sp. 40-6]|nr:MAG: hypothetical protein BGO90_08595 [Legionella sp. 40-6]